MDEKKVREAIKYFKIMLFDMEGMGFKYIPKYYETAIEALEKQLPKKTIDKSCVKDNDTIYGYVGICPSCNGIVDDSMIVCDCTQVLDWSE
ncbi:transcription factor [Ruminococcus phage phiRM10]|uniref:Transcription factor n=1 Tax=Ruminococcus phage phiRM10 TaxID=2772516 RepID=A0AAE7T374_9CAUD|nr:transcription factor [Ruminococcus phage phiRM10]